MVRAYVDALDANDEETASRLITSEHHELSWIGSVEAITELKTWEPVREDPRWSGHPRTAEVVRVPVRFDVTWSDPDPSVEDGPADVELPADPGRGLRPLADLRRGHGLRLDRPRHA